MEAGRTNQQVTTTRWWEWRPDVVVVEARWRPDGGQTHRVITMLVVDLAGVAGG